MHSVELNEISGQIDHVLRRVRAGEDVVVLHEGRPVARLVAVDRRTAARVPGTGKGDFDVAADFDETPPGLLDDFGRQAG